MGTPERTTDLPKILRAHSKLVFVDVGVLCVRTCAVKRWNESAPLSLSVCVCVGIYIYSIIQSILTPHLFLLSSFNSMNPSSSLCRYELYSSDDAPNPFEQERKQKMNNNK